MRSLFNNMRLAALTLFVCGLLAIAPTHAATFDTIAAFQYVSDTNRTLQPSYIWRLLGAVTETSLRTGLQPERLLALMKVESTFNRKAVSPAGAKGLTQVIPRYHQDKLAEAQQLYGSTDLHNVKVSTYVGARVLQDYAEGRSVNTAFRLYSGGKRGYAQTVLREERKIRSLIY